ncbi:hypothetical protein ZHAS_00022205 [Anopheles sinensis]|uniref:Uncharacterized protein n=1 Tax=Anopheles sinensis TaxID=74873 RepID=A0A084WUR3_ANOSI|nr:hypothetical protein ZHAS_00022205 [Anopheles sinensis]
MAGCRSNGPFPSRICVPYVLGCGFVGAPTDSPRSEMRSGAFSRFRCAICGLCERSQTDCPLVRATSTQRRRRRSSPAASLSEHVRACRTTVPKGQTRPRFQLLPKMCVIGWTHLEKSAERARNGHRFVRRRRK